MLFNISPLVQYCSTFWAWNVLFTMIMYYHYLHLLLFQCISSIWNDNKISQWLSWSWLLHAFSQSASLPQWHLLAVLFLPPPPYPCKRLAQHSNAKPGLTRLFASSKASIQKTTIAAVLCSGLFFGWVGGVILQRIPGLSLTTSFWS